MSDNISNYLELKLLDHGLGVSAFTMPATLYLALFTSDPTDAGSGTECSGSAYARVAITFDAASTNTSGVSSTQNADAVTFPRALGSWGTITHLAVYDALTGGNLLWHGAATDSQAITTNQIYEIGDGDLDITLA